MKTIKNTIIFLLLFPNNMVSAQQFWLTTNEFWGGPKTGIVLVEDSVFIIGTNHSVLRSTNECDQLEIVLTASEIHTVFASENGKLFAGGTGKIFFSDDLGLSWDSVLVNTGYPLKQIVENGNGELFAITGIFDDGDGVFYSGDNGYTWGNRNSGLNSYLGCDKIAIDKNGRLYLAVSDENVYGYGGLFISENNGLMWQKLSVRIDSFISTVRIGKTTGLSILPNDNIYLSFYGSGKYIGIQLNIYKSIYDITKDNPWEMLDVSNSTISGMDDVLNNIYIAQSGDWYSSVNGAIHQGGTCFSHDGVAWEILGFGLGTDTINMRNEQYFAETSEGRIFMIQYMDERIYKTDTSLVTSIKNPVLLNNEILIYPNPVLKSEKFNVQINDFEEFSKLSIYDYSGRKIYSDFLDTQKGEITAPPKEGIYFVELITRKSKKSAKIIVR